MHPAVGGYPPALHCMGPDHAGEEQNGVLQRVEGELERAEEQWARAAGSIPPAEDDKLGSHHQATQHAGESAAAPHQFTNHRFSKQRININVFV